MTATQDEVPPRELTSDDYFRTAAIVATCKNERLPYVLAYLSKAGLSTVCPVQTQEEQRDRYEIMRLLVKATRPSARRRDLTERRSGCTAQVSASPKRDGRNTSKL